MALPKLLFAHLRRSPPLFSLSPLSYSRISFLNSGRPKPTTETRNFHHAFRFINSRSFSSTWNQRDSHFLADSPTELSSLQVRDFDRVDVDKSSVPKMTGSSSSLGRESPYFVVIVSRSGKSFYELLTLLLIGVSIPLGSLVYWVTDRSSTVILQIFTKHHVVRVKLGLPATDSPAASAESGDMSKPLASLDGTSKQTEVSVENLNAQQLFKHGNELLHKQDWERAIALLQLGLQKDPNCVEALIVLGSALLNKSMYVEARGHLERAISLLLVAGNPTKVKHVGFLISASQLAAFACILQGKNAEGIVHLERVASLKEPDDPELKRRYFNSLLWLGRFLYREGRKAEAAKHLGVALDFDAGFKELFKAWGLDEEFVREVVNGRRKDY